MSNPRYSLKVVGIFLAAGLVLMMFIPVGNTLWANFMGIRGEAITYDFYTPTVTETATATDNVHIGDCTATVGYWKNSPDDWPPVLLEIGYQPYTFEQAMNLLFTTPSGDATIILVQQLIAAKLNVANGADPAVMPGDILVAADDWLLTHPLFSAPVDPDRQVGIDLAVQLEYFNDSGYGIAACPNLPLTETPTLTLTLTETPTLTETVEAPGGLAGETTPTPTLTPTFTETPTPTFTPTLEGVTEEPTTEEPSIEPTTETVQPTEETTEPPPVEPPAETTEPPPSDPPQYDTPTGAP